MYRAFAIFYILQGVHPVIIHTEPFIERLHADIALDDLRKKGFTQCGVETHAPGIGWTLHDPDNDSENSIFNNPITDD